MEEIILETVSCPKCGGHAFAKANVEKGIFACTKPSCYGIAVKCEKCNDIYPSDSFGKHGDVYECKKCGAVNWPYTDMIRNREEALKILAGESFKLDSILSRLK